MSNQDHQELEDEVVAQTASTHALVLWALTGGALLAASLVIAYVSTFWPISSAHDRWGQFGDYFGGILNPIFSFLGLFVIANTLRLQVTQARQTALDRKQNSLILDRQLARAELVQFQTTFFQLLNLHNKIVQESVIDSGFGAQFHGRDVFRLMVARIESIARDGGKYPKGDEEKIQDELEIYEQMYRRHQDLLAHYFRNLYHVIKFIDMNQEIDRQYYADLLRAQLSSSEAVLLFYNGLSRWRVDRAKPLIEEYGLLKTLPVHLDLPKSLAVRYATCAFRHGFIDELNAR